MLLLHNSRTKQEAAISANVSFLREPSTKTFRLGTSGTGRCSFVPALAARLYSLCTARDFSSIMFPFLESEQAVDKSWLTRSFIRDGSQASRWGLLRPPWSHSWREEASCWDPLVFQPCTHMQHRASHFITTLSGLAALETIHESNFTTKQSGALCSVSAAHWCSDVNVLYCCTKCSAALQHKLQ